jgi:hypothetical protein
MVTKEGEVRKTNDKVDLVSKYDRLLKNNLYYSSMVNLKTQMTPGYDYEKDSLISNFLAPGYVLTTFGLEYRLERS